MGGGRGWCQTAFGLAAGCVLAQALALEPEVVRTGKWPPYAPGPRAVAVAVQGDYAYVAAKEGGLVLIDIGKPANPQRVGGYDTSGTAEAVAVAADYAYVADFFTGLQVIEVRDPAHPQRLGGCANDSGGPAWDVAVAGNYAYVADGWGGLQVIDVRDPAHPQRVGGFRTTGPANGVAVAGNYAYVASADTGLVVVDLLNLAGDRFHFLVRGQPGQKVRVQRSLNLTDWQDWQEVTLGDSPADVSDTDFLSAPRWFCRAVAP